MKAPYDVSVAITKTIKWALVYCRNYTLGPAPDIKQINELMEAIHDIPDHTYRWRQDSLDEIRIHLGCFDHTKWPGSPNLVEYFENELKNQGT